MAEIIQRVRPEVVLINEFDYIDGPIDGNALTDAFQANYLGIGQNGAGPIAYPYVFVAPSNTGIASGFDSTTTGRSSRRRWRPATGTTRSASASSPASSGWPSSACIRSITTPPGPSSTSSGATCRARSCRTTRRPGPADWYSPEELAILPLSSKSHWDLPIDIGGSTVHFLVSHPTPPVFDGPEDRNGRRNFDEIRFWADYLTPGKAGYIYDDQGRTGGLKPGSSFVIAGDQNSDPLDGDSVPGAIQQLLEHPRVNAASAPSSEGAVEAARLQGGANATHRSDPRFDTADFADGAPGNLRADYVLLSRNLRIADSEVFWPVQADALFRLTGVFPFPSSDHRLVWVDVIVPGSNRAG